MSGTGYIHVQYIPPELDSQPRKERREKSNVVFHLAIYKMNRESYVWACMALGVCPFPVSLVGISFAPPANFKISPTSSVN